MEKKIIDVIKKVREMFKYDTTLRHIVAVNPSVNLGYKDGGLYIVDITFNHYDILVVGNNGIVFIPEHGNRRDIMSFNGLDKFLNEM